MRCLNLESLFRRYNRRYFSGRIAKTRVIAIDGKERPRNEQGLYVAAGGYVLEVKPGRRRSRRVYGPLILVRVGGQYDNAVKMTLLHEMCHAVTDGNHGRAFQREMLRLARAGAFNKLW